MDALTARIETNLAAFSRREIGGDRRRAAVAIVVAPAAGIAGKQAEGSPAGPVWLLTRRAMHLRRNPGNYALPGGGLDEGEDAIAAALRETEEELGVTLPRSAARGLLDDFAALSGPVVTPVVVVAEAPLVLRPNPEEVKEAWGVPLADLDHPEAPRFVPQAEGPPILRMYARGSWINPPTAAFLWQFREVALYGREARTDGLVQPGWTAR